MTGVPYLIVDAFTADRFRGNPAAVCFLRTPGEAQWMQLVAREMNLSETAFVHPEGGGLRLRWFSPEVEVPLCGHATLATAHALWETGRLPRPDRARFETLSGRLEAWREADRIGLDFPATAAARPGPVPGFAEALGVPVVGTLHAGNWRIAELDSESAVRDLTPDLAALARLEPPVVAVTARAGTPGADYVCRVFGPRVGVPEDPVTGSAQCALGPLWGSRLGKDELVVRQLSARGGDMTVRVRGDRVHLLGRAVTVAHGRLA